MRSSVAAAGFATLRAFHGQILIFVHLEGGHVGYGSSKNLRGVADVLFDTVLKQNVGLPNGDVCSQAGFF